MEKSEAKEIIESNATPTSSQTSERSPMERVETAEITIAERVAAPNSFQVSKVSFERKPDAAEVTVIEGTATPTSLQTSEGSFVEKALAAENITYLRGWRLHFLSLRSAPLDHSCCFANDTSAWPFYSSLSTSKSQLSGHP